MMPEDKIIYKRLQRQVQESYSKLFDQGNFGRIKNKSPKRFNNKLAEMQQFLSSLTDGDYSKNRFMKCDPLDEIKKQNP